LFTEPNAVFGIGQWLRHRALRPKKKWPERNLIHRGFTRHPIELGLLHDGPVCLELWSFAFEACQNTFEAPSMSSFKNRLDKFRHVKESSSCWANQQQVQVQVSKYIFNIDFYATIDVPVALALEP